MARSVEADNGPNGNAESIRIADRFAAEDERQRLWLDAHLPRIVRKGTGGPCKHCGRPLSSHNATGVCSTCREQIKWHGYPGPSVKRAPLRKRKIP